MPVWRTAMPQRYAVSTCTRAPLCGARPQISWTTPQSLSRGLQHDGYNFSRTCFWDIHKLAGARMPALMNVRQQAQMCVITFPNVALQSRAFKQALKTHLRK